MQVREYAFHLKSKDIPLSLDSYQVIPHIQNVSRKLEFYKIQELVEYYKIFMSAEGLTNVFEIIDSFKSFLFTKKWMNDLILYTTYAQFLFKTTDF